MERYAGMLPSSSKWEVLALRFMLVELSLLKQLHLNISPRNCPRFHWLHSQRDFSSLLKM
jgi:hypothetical protein